MRSIKHPPTLILISTSTEEEEGEKGRGQPAVGMSLSAHQNVSWRLRQEFRPVGPTVSPANESRALVPFDLLYSPSRPTWKPDV